MASLNKVMLMGNLTRDPDLRYTPSGQAVCEFSIAMNHRYISGEQEREEVCFVEIVVWAKQAESCGKYLTKGASVFVEGRLKQDTWEDRDGRKRSKIRVTADRVHFISTKNSEMGSQAQQPNNNMGYNQPQERYNNSNNYTNQNRQPAAPGNYNEPMPEPPDDIYDNDFETEDDIPF